MFLSTKNFKQVVDLTPLVSIDLIVSNEANEALLGLRNNRPAQGFWFVPGGRILKNEPIDRAFKRLTQAELGREFEISKARFLGVYEHFYTDSSISESISTHYVVLAYHLSVTAIDLQLPGDQHQAFKWLLPADLVDASNVHQHTKNYFSGSGDKSAHF